MEKYLAEVDQAIAASDATGSDARSIRILMKEHYAERKGNVPNIEGEVKHCIRLLRKEAECQ